MELMDAIVAIVGVVVAFVGVVVAFAFVVVAFVAFVAFVVQMVDERKTMDNGLGHSLSHDVARHDVARHDVARHAEVVPTHNTCGWHDM